MKNLFIFLAIVCTVPVYAQVDRAADTVKERSVIIIDNADHTKFIRGEGYFLYGNVQMRQDSVYFRADTAIKDENEFNAWKDVSIQQGDSLSVFGDSLYYSGDSLRAYLYEDVSLVDRERILFTNHLVYELDNKVASYTSGGLLTDHDAQLVSKIGRYEARTDLMFFEDSVRVTHPDFLLKADSLAYNMKGNRALFRGPTLMTFDSTRIYCEKGYYDIESQVGHLNKNAQYTRGAESASGDRIEYYGETDRTYMIGNAFFEDDERFAEADTILYDGQARKTWLIGNAYFSDDNTEARGKVIVFNNGTGEVYTEGRSTVSLEEQLLTADSTYLSQDQENGYASGGVIWEDTVDGMTLYAPELFYHKRQERIETRGGRPLFAFSGEEGDTLYMSADTILSFLDTISFETDSLNRTDSFRVLKAFHDVRIWSDDLSAICDSLVYREKDSLFILYGNPFLWADSAQIFSDTIRLQMANGELRQLHAWNNSFMIEKVAGEYFNQVKSREMDAFFEKGILEKVVAQGNAQSYYYILDEDDAFMGFQESVCSRIEAEFDSTSNLQKINFINEVKGRIIPIKGLDPKSKRYDGFHWAWAVKPKSIEDLQFDTSLSKYIAGRIEVKNVGEQSASK